MTLEEIEKLSDCKRFFYALKGIKEKGYKLDFNQGEHYVIRERSADDKVIYIAHSFDQFIGFCDSLTMYGPDISVGTQG